MHIQSIIDLVNVFIAYFILIILVTSFMIKPIAKDENIFKRFVMYLVVGNFYVINIVFILAYLNIFNKLVLIITLLCMTLFIRIILDKKNAKKIYEESRDTIKHLLDGEYGVKLFLQRKLVNIRLSLKSFGKELFSSKKLEWIIFLSIMCYNLYYYSYNSINFVSLAAPDEEVHLYWIQSLIGGNIFPSGVYPHGFHNIISAISVIFGFKAVRVINSFGIVSMILIMTMLYFGLRKILESKYAALLALMVYSLANIYVVESIYRYQFSIPQEYGMILLMPMAIFLLDYLKDKKMRNLILFGMCLSMTISIHFYISIIALVLCVSIGIAYLYRIIKRKLLIKLILCGVLSAVVAIAPLATGLAMGHKMEQSMNWAVSVIQGNEYEDSDENTDEIIDYNLEEMYIYSDWHNFKREARKEITKYAFLDTRIMNTLLILIALTIFHSIFLIALRNNNEENLNQLSFGIFGLLLIFLMLCRPLNIPTVMEPKRVAIFLNYFSTIFIAIPFEILYRVLAKIKKIGSVVTFIAIPVFLLFIVKFGLVRPLLPFYYFQTKGAMLVDCEIMEKYNDFKWTIVSPVNDTSVIQNNGYHYELSDFIMQQENWNEDIEIKIPTKYVFIYIEKRPINLYGYIFYQNDKEIVNRDMVTYEDAKKPLEKGKKDNAYYKEDRRILMSKIYYWAEEYKKYFPKEMSVYYEDDEFLVYRIEQNEYALNNFSINYGANANSDDR
ncbi:hypothetical protein SH2C18_14740 [Clostridium sediminicola]|uniref:hypothetical protein n=1 Tax=Clostridium sediminicola TaxID=3114879 RepID=UPI0031F23CDC